MVGGVKDSFVDFSICERIRCMISRSALSIYSSQNLDCCRPNHSTPEEIFKCAKSPKSSYLDAKFGRYQELNGDLLRSQLT
jgi:hypothetical protein